ncbi:MAG: gamma-glutamylcyclotransferase family protein [Planctomycetota bacterium]|jgi:gamma-glutamylcyclotransferase (GGCT)/AIG2-like uncharacterized protein YtfP
MSDTLRDEGSTDDAGVERGPNDTDDAGNGKAGHRIFVYGTLRRGQAQASLLAGATHLELTRTAPAYTLMDLGPFPALLDHGSTAVVGDVYVVDTETCAQLDAYEGTPHLYQRRDLNLENGSVAEGYIYVGRIHRNHRLLPSGDWTRR